MKNGAKLSIRLFETPKTLAKISDEALYLFLIEMDLCYFNNIIIKYIKLQFPTSHYLFVKQNLLFNAFMLY